MFIAALFIIAKIWNQSRCPTIEDRIKKMWHMYTMEHYSSIKENKIVICRKMDGTGDYHIKQHKPSLEGKIPCFCSHVESKPEKIIL
jgi:hypothetical protein